MRKREYKKLEYNPDILIGYVNSNSCDNIGRLNPYKRLMFTKDGRKVGNGICIGQENENFVVITDIGEKKMFSEDELRNLFFFGDKAPKTHKHYFGLTPNHIVEHF